MVSGGRFRTIGWAMAALTVTLCFNSRAAAYVPPAPFLLEQMQQALGQAAAAVIRQHVTVFNSSGQPDGPGLRETVKFWFPDRFRSDLEGPSIRRIQLVCRSGRLTAVNGRIVSEAESRYDTYKNIFLAETGALQTAQLASSGVDLDVTSPGRLDGRPVYVVGANYPDMDAAQIWLDKETFRPARWILPPAVGSREAGRLDVRYARWRQVEAFWYPEEISFYIDGTPVRRIRVDSVEITDGFEATLFDLGALKSSLVAASPFEHSQPGAADEVREAIENFRRLYE